MPKVVERGRLRITRSVLFRLIALLVIALPLSWYLPPQDNGFDGPLHLAERILHGYTYFDEHISYWEEYQRNGHWYLAYSPMNSVVLMPYVALGGSKLGMGFANGLIVTGSTILLWLLMRRECMLRRWADLGAVAYFFGTPFLYGISAGTVWSLMHSEGNLFLLAALCLAQRRRWAGCGFCYAVAIGCRSSLLFSVPLLLPLFLSGRNRSDYKRRLARRLFLLGQGALLPTAVMLLLQASMTGNPLLSPYQVAWHQWGIVVPPVSTDYIRVNLHFYFLEMPLIQNTPPYVRFPPSGQAFWTVTPFMLLLVHARLRSRLLQGALLGAIGGFFGYLLYFYNGYMQYGSRYITDLFPFLVPLAFSSLSAYRVRPLKITVRALAFLLIALSIAINVTVALMLHAGTLPT